MTEHQIVSAIENYVTSSEGVTNFPVSSRQVADEVNTLRMRQIEDMDKQRLFVRPWDGFVQIIEAADTIKVGLDYEIAIPRIYTLQNGMPALSYVGSSDFAEPYRVVNGEMHNLMSDSEYPDAPYAWVTPDGKIKIRNAEPTKVSIRGVFEKPSEFQDFKFTYNPKTTSYPLPSGLIDQIIGKTAEAYLRTLYRTLPQPNVQTDIPQQGQQ